MRIINDNGRACSLGARRIWLLSGALAFAAWATASPADVPDAAAAAQRIAITVCGTCHGPAGNSLQPKFPRLAGQHANYLSAQLKAFRSQTRGDPDAIGYMWGMASELDDATIEALAGYYAAQKAATSSRSTDAALIARGRDIYEHGISAEGVPACSS